MDFNISSTMDSGRENQFVSKNAAQTCYTKSVKLAVAIALIKGRPPGKTGRQHAEDLAARLGRSELSWKTKAESLRAEVLRLRQELLLSKMLPKHSRNGNGFMESSSKDPNSSSALLLETEQTDNLDLDSGCGTENNTESLLCGADTDKQLEDEAGPSTSCLAAAAAATTTTAHPRQPRFPSPSSSDQQDRELLAHARFLQNLCGLRKLPDALGMLCIDGHSSESGSGSGSGSVVWESVCQLLGSLVAASQAGDGGGDGGGVGAGAVDPCHPPPPSPPPQQPLLLLQAAQVVAQAVEKWQAHSRLPKGFLAQAEECMEKMTSHLLRNAHLNRFSLQECLSDCLIRLGASTTLRAPLLRLLLSHINHLADHLWHTCQEDVSCKRAAAAAAAAVGPPEVERYENSFYLFWVLEQLLRANGSAAAAEVGEGTRDLLERQVARLADEYPLFSLYLWRIGGLLKTSANASTSTATTTPAPVH
ncbi:meiosis-specific protein MEI4 [Engraulis encrasicolus]|uniref:meiosis-specific protein MEI4 n=1 Tax=Engraulis encrasicolus TaxID=184585 RepID=UPI002FD50F31